MIRKKKIVFLLLAIILLQMKTYCSPTEKSEFNYKSFYLSASGFLFPKDKKDVFNNFDGCSIGVKIFKKNFIEKLTLLPHKIENIIGYFLFFRSFYVEIIKAFFFCDRIFTIYNKGRHKISRSPFLNIDFGYSFTKENTKAFFRVDNNKAKERCIICLNDFHPKDEKDDLHPKDEETVVVAHFYTNTEGNEEMGHFMHEYCLKRWLVDKDTCPSCREKVAKGIMENMNGEEEGKAQENFDFFTDFFRLTLQFAKFTYEYTLSNYREFHFSLISSICPLIFTAKIPVMFFKHFSLKDLNEKKEMDSISIDWENFFSIPDSLTFSFCTKINIGFNISIQKVGALFELSYIHTHYKKKIDEPFSPRRNNNSDENNDNKRPGFEIKITILIKTNDTILIN